MQNAVMWITKQIKILETNNNKFIEHYLIVKVGRQSHTSFSEGENEKL